MQIEIKGAIPVTGDCGHKFEIPIARVNDEFECPACGTKDRFTAEQIESILSEARAAASNYGIEQIGKIHSDAIRKAVKGSKHIKFKRK